MAAQPQAGLPPLAIESPEARRWTYLDNIRKHRGAFMSNEQNDSEEFNGEEVVKCQEERTKILVIGAGGLGCEILKDLALSGFKDIHVIDMDTIDVSNLNRQFLFRHADVGKSKAEVAARFVMNRVKGVSITPHNCRIQDKPDDFYKQFAMAICGLDSIEARRWINAKLIGIFDHNDPDTLTILIDGGTEGFKGQSRVIVPTLTTCYECTLDMHARRAAVPLCTLASIPRQPEHCIEWAHIVAWEKEKPFPKLDNDDPQHITWLYRKALERAEEFEISGVTYSLTQGVVKNIIPAIASTNAIIAASCCNEALKIATGCAPALSMSDNYMMYSGNDSIYTYTFAAERKYNCPVCVSVAHRLEVDTDITVLELVEKISMEHQLKAPSIRSERHSIYVQMTAGLEESTRPNLMKKLAEFVGDGEEIAVSDRSIDSVFMFRIRFKAAASRESA